jgi:predicted ATPase
MTWRPSGLCSLLALDITSFSDQGRTDHARQHIRDVLYKLVGESFASCDAPLEGCYSEDRGDGMIIVVPPTIRTALLASTLIDRIRAGLRHHNELSSDMAHIQLRVALHVGEVWSDAHGLVGTAVIRVFRLLDAPAFRQALAGSNAELGFIASDQVHQDVLSHLTDLADLVDLAEFSPVEVRVKETLTRGWIRIPGGPAPREQAAVLPHADIRPVTSFVGRQEELTRLRALVQRSRLVTLVGPGGAGKTRLALETLRVLAETGDHACADGAYVIDLTTYHAGDGLSQALLTALQLATRSSYGPPEHGGADDALVAALSHRRILLVLDNCEQLLDEAAGVAETILTRTANTVILATSRETLGVTGEMTLAVGPLDMPSGIEFEDPCEAMLGYPAVQLFVDRAGAAAPSFRFGPANCADIARICRRLDGLPLAIELAAARVRALAPSQIADLLADRFRLLASGSRTVARHRTLEAVVDWSHDLLTEPAREAFAYLSVFRGGFHLRMAQEHGARLGIAAASMTDLVVELVDKSLLQAIPADDCGMRYRMLETIREYGLARLTDRGRAEEAKRHHAELYMDLAERQNPAIQGAGQSAAVRVLEHEDDNLRAAFEFGCLSGDHELVLRLVDALGWYLWIRGERVFGWPGLLRALDVRPAEQDSLRRARALIWTCHLGSVGITQPEARDHGTQARAILERLKLTGVPEYALCLLVEAYACYRGNDHAEGDGRIARSMELTERLGDPLLRGWSEIVAGIGLVLRGRFAEARTVLDASKGHYRRSGNIWGEHRAQIWLSRMYENIGDLEHALQAADEALNLVSSLDLGEAAAPLMGWIARLHMVRGDEAAAAAAVADVERTRFWTATPEATAWLAECRAVRAERHAWTMTGQCRAAAMVTAAELHGKAAAGLTKAGLPVYAIHNTCRQAVLLVRAGKSVEDLLTSVAQQAEAELDPQARAMVMDTVVLTAPTRECATSFLVEADKFWNQLPATRSPLFAADLEAVRR